MAQMFVKGQLVTGPDQFKNLVEEALKTSPARPVVVSRFVPVQTMVARLVSYSAMWQAESPVLGLDQAVHLRQVLVDFCDILDLAKEERAFILAVQLPLPNEGEK
jgi:hypothetical protein